MKRVELSKILPKNNFLIENFKTFVFLRCVPRKYFEFATNSSSSTVEARHQNKHGVMCVFSCLKGVLFTHGSQLGHHHDHQIDSFTYLANFYSGEIEKDSEEGN